MRLSTTLNFILLRVYHIIIFISIEIKNYFHNYLCHIIKIVHEKRPRVTARGLFLSIYFYHTFIRVRMYYAICPLKTSHMRGKYYLFPTQAIRRHVPLD